MMILKKIFSFNFMIFIYVYKKKKADSKTSPTYKPSSCSLWKMRICVWVSSYISQFPRLAYTVTGLHPLWTVVLYHVVLYCHSCRCSLARSCPTLCDPVDCSMSDFPAHHQLLELAQTHVHWVSDATKPSHPLSSPSPPALNLSQHQGLFQWVRSLHQVTKELESQLQLQSFQ